mmetsp:Transcript_16948/g.23823  ORF Transcript_16948/g.23823 Transcript_16948/m.23823 type:complete len:91 (+) Transcript_16948:220-492(+)
MLVIRLKAGWLGKCCKSSYLLPTLTRQPWWETTVEVDLLISSIAFKGSKDALVKRFRVTPLSVCSKLCQFEQVLCIGRSVDFRDIPASKL